MQPISKLLSPFLSRPVTGHQLEQFQLYLDLLQKWNARISLTAIRDPDEIVRRHFGESLFAGEQLEADKASTLIDIGSGAGFPGLPIKVLAPQLKVTLIESQQKKVAFLREMVRSLGLKDVTVYADRAEEARLKSQIVTMRAVEKFSNTLSIAARLMEAGGRLALLIGTGQEPGAHEALPEIIWAEPIKVPDSRERVLLIGQRS